MARSNIRIKYKGLSASVDRLFCLACLYADAFIVDTVNQQGGAGGRIMPNITGGAGEVLVVMDSLIGRIRQVKCLQDILKEEILWTSTV